MWLNPPPPSPPPPSLSLMWLTQFFLHSLRPTNQSCCEFSKLLECTRFDLKLNNSLTFALNQCNNYHGRAYPRSQAIFFTDKICPKLGDDAAHSLSSGLQFQQQSCPTLQLTLLPPLFLPFVSWEMSIVQHWRRYFRLL